MPSPRLNLGNTRRLIWRPSSWRLSNQPGASAIPEIIVEANAIPGQQVLPREFSLKPKIPTDIDEIPPEGIAIPQDSPLTLLEGYLNQAAGFGFGLALTPFLAFAVSWWFGGIFIGYFVVLRLVAAMKARLDTDEEPTKMIAAVLHALVILGPAIILLAYIHFRLHNLVLLLIVAIVIEFVIIITELVRYERPPSRQTRLVNLGVTAASVGAFYVGGLFNITVQLGFGFIVLVLAIGAIVIRMRRPIDIGSPRELIHELWFNMKSYLLPAIIVASVLGLIVGGGLLYLVAAYGRPSTFVVRASIFIVLLLSGLIAQIRQTGRNWEMHIRWWGKIIIFTKDGFIFQEFAPDSLLEPINSGSGSNDFKRALSETGGAKPTNKLIRLINFLPGQATFVGIGKVTLFDESNTPYAVFSDMAQPREMGALFTRYAQRQEALERAERDLLARSVAAQENLAKVMSRFNQNMERSFASTSATPRNEDNDPPTEVLPAV